MKSILIVGHGRSGKDTAAEFLHGREELCYAGSTSWFALPFMVDRLKLPAQCAWERRHEQREKWFTECTAMRKYDPLFLVRRALYKGNIVTGVRDKVEIDAAKASGWFSSILWIERPGIPDDPTVKFTRDDATDVIINDETLTVFEARVLRWAKSKNYL